MSFSELLFLLSHFPPLVPVAACPYTTVIFLGYWNREVYLKIPHALCIRWRSELGFNSNKSSVKNVSIHPLSGEDCFTLILISSISSDKWALEISIKFRLGKWNSDSFASLTASHSTRVFIAFTFWPRDCVQNQRLIDFVISMPICNIPKLFGNAKNHPKWPRMIRKYTYRILKHLRALSHTLHERLREWQWIVAV